MVGIKTQKPFTESNLLPCGIIMGRRFLSTPWWLGKGMIWLVMASPCCDVIPNEKSHAK